MQKCYHSGIAHRYDLYSYQLYYSASVDNIFLKYSSCFFQQQMGPGGVPVGAKTSEFYRTENVPNRFENPGLWPQNCIFMSFKMLATH